MARNPKDRPVDPHWEKIVDEIYMRFNLLQGYDRPTLMNWVAIALRDAYELGLEGKPYAITEFVPEPAHTVVRRTRPVAPAIEEGAALRVKRIRRS